MTCEEFKKYKESVEGQTGYEVIVTINIHKDVTLTVYANDIRIKRDGEGNIKSIYIGKSDESFQHYITGVLKEVMR